MKNYIRTLGDAFSFNDTVLILHLMFIEQGVLLCPITIYDRKGYTTWQKEYFIGSLYSVTKKVIARICK